MTLTSWTINASFLLMIVWMQRHGRWHTFAIAMKGGYTIKTGSTTGKKQPPKVQTAIPGVGTIPKAVLTGPINVFVTHVEHLVK